MYFTTTTKLAAYWCTEESYKAPHKQYKDELFRNIAQGQEKCLEFMTNPALNIQKPVKKIGRSLGKVASTKLKTLKADKKNYTERRYI